MRIVTWNCGMAFRRKMNRLLDWHPDVMVIQECEEPGILASCLGDDWDHFWVGDNRHKGLSVFIRRCFGAHGVHLDVQGIRYMLVVETRFDLDIMAFWAMDDKHDRMQRYIGQVWKGLQLYAGYASRLPIVIGDFNWNAAFVADEPLYGTLSDVIHLLDEHGICSVYHTLKHVTYGREPEPTFYMHRSESKGYHIDYAFIPELLLESATSIQLGNFSEWVELSDHIPIFIDIGVDHLGEK